MVKKSSLDKPEYRLELSKYRFERAMENVDASKQLLESGHTNISVSRSYYAVFYALLAVTELDGFESAKHSGVISYFNRNYIKTGVFDAGTSKIINSVFEGRRYADYEGLYIAEVEEAQNRLDIAKSIINMIQPYLESRWAKMEGE